MHAVSNFSRTPGPALRLRAVVFHTNTAMFVAEFAVFHFCAFVFLFSFFKFSVSRTFCQQLQLLLHGDSGLVVGWFGFFVDYFGSFWQWRLDFSVVCVSIVGNWMENSYTCT